MKLATLTLALALAVAAAQAQTASGQAAPAQGTQTQNTQQAQQAPAGNAEAGKKSYNVYGCYQCHGYEGQGAAATGPRLAPRPIAFAAFTRYVRSPTGLMPVYTPKVLADKDLADIYAFLQARPTPPPVANIPLLKP